MLSRSLLVVLAPNSSSISSRVFMRVSGRKKSGNDRNGQRCAASRAKEGVRTNSEEAKDGECSEEEVRPSVCEVLEHQWADQTDDAARAWAQVVSVCDLRGGGVGQLEQTHKLHIHVAEVVIEVPVERVERLKISLGRTHPICRRLSESAFGRVARRLVLQVRETHRSPRKAEEYVVDVHEGNCHPPCTLMCRPVVSVRRNEGSDHDQRRETSDAARHEEWTAADDIASGYRLVSSLRR